MNDRQAVPVPPASRAVPALVPEQAATDAQLVELRLHGRSEHTRRAYRADVECLLRHAQKPLCAITLADLQAFADSLEALAPASRARTLAGVKSLLSFGRRSARGSPSASSTRPPSTGSSPWKVTRATGRCSCCSAPPACGSPSSWR